MHTNRRHSLRIISLLLAAALTVCTAACKKKEEQHDLLFPVGDLSEATVQSDEQETIDGLDGDLNSFTEWHSFTARSAYSEGLLFVTIEGMHGVTSAYYMDKEGNAVIEVPSDCKGGDFSEGYAVLSKPGSAALIDKTGAYVFPWGEYQAFSIVSDGVTLGYKVDQSYAGTTERTDIIDVKTKTVLWSMEGHIDAQYHYTDGLLAYKDTIYDKNGNVLLKADRDDIKINAETLNADYCIVGTSWKKYSDAEGTLTILDKNAVSLFDITVPRWVCDEFKTGKPMYGGYALGWYGTSGEVTIIGADGSVVTAVVEGLAGMGGEIRPTDHARWIVPLHNNYYGVIDETGAFVFEPVEGSLSYLGDGLYLNYTTGYVLDENGTVLSNYPVSTDAHYYGDEMMVLSRMGSVICAKDGQTIDQITITRDLDGNVIVE